MKLSRRAIACLAGLFVLVPAISLMTSSNAARKKTADDAGTLAITGAKIYRSPDAEPISNGVVVVRGGTIVATGEKGKVEIPANASVIDASGMVVTAGFQNSHVHFTEPKWMDAANLPAGRLTQQFREMLTRYGFTTVVDTGSVLPNTTTLRGRVESGEIAGPRILTAGGPLYPPNGIPYYLKNALPPDILKLLAQPSTPEEAVRAVQRNFDGGADIIKLFTGSWISRGEVLPMPVEIAMAAAAEAHRHGKLVFTHPSNIAGLEVALASHVDVLAHSIEDTRGWNGSYIARMKAAGMSLVPTLNLFGSDDNLAEILKEVGDYSRAGGQVLFGTDVGYLSEYDPSNEYVLLSRAGLNVRQILASLTTAPAKRFGESNSRGRIARGMTADLVVLAGDPASDVRNFSRVKYTLRAGKVIYEAPGN